MKNICKYCCRKPFVICVNDAVSDKIFLIMPYVLLNYRNKVNSILCKRMELEIALSYLANRWRLTDK